MPQVTFTVNRSPTHIPSSIDYAVAGTATLNLDYEIVSVSGTGVTVTGSTINFAIGASQANIVLNVIEDGLPENDKTIIINLLNPLSPATVVPPTIVDNGLSTTILDDDDYLLDVITGASGAYSLRLLNSSYTGNCIRVRRSSDNSEQNIGFVNSQLDTASLLSFCGSGNGFVVTWYDQSGNSRNVTQSVASSQPRIINSGALITDDNGRPTLNFTSGLAYLSRTDALGFTGNAEFSIFSVTKTTATTTQQRIVGFGSNTGVIKRTLSLTVGLTGGWAVRYNDGNEQYGGYIPGWSLFAITKPTGGTYISPNAYLNGVELVRIADANPTLNLNLINEEFNIGVGRNNTNTIVEYFTGLMSEVILYPTELTTSRATVQNNINSYYSIY